MRRAFVVVATLGALSVVPSLARKSGQRVSCNGSSVYTATVIPHFSPFPVDRLLHLDLPRSNPLR